MINNTVKILKSLLPNDYLVHYKLPKIANDIHIGENYIIEFPSTSKTSSTKLKRFKAICLAEFETELPKDKFINVLKARVKLILNDSINK